MSSYPAFGGVFCYNKRREKKNFCPMKTLAKIVLGVLAYNYMKADLRRDPDRNLVCGHISNMPARPIENNGGL